MPSTFAEVQALVREQLVEPEPIFWSSEELHGILTRGAKDLWRSVVDLKQEHYLRVNTTDVFIPSGGTQLMGVPSDVHKIYLIEPRNVDRQAGGSSTIFTPLDYNHDDFRGARAYPRMSPPYSEIFYAIHGQGSPVSPPTIEIAPSITTTFELKFCYVPTLDPMQLESTVPIPGEADNALVAWGMAYARAKEREDRTPDPGWLAIYNTEKKNLLQSLGLRQYQEVQTVDGVFDALW